MQFTGLPDAFSLDGVPDDLATGPNHHGYGPYLDVDALMASIASGYDLGKHAQAPYNSSLRDSGTLQGSTTGPSGISDALRRPEDRLHQTTPVHGTSVDMIRNMWDRDTLAQYVACVRTDLWWLTELSRPDWGAPLPDAGDRR